MVSLPLVPDDECDLDSSSGSVIQCMIIEVKMTLVDTGQPRPETHADG